MPSGVYKHKTLKEEGIKEIGQGAFSHTKIKEVAFPKSLKKILTAFEYCGEQSDCDADLYRGPCTGELPWQGL